MQRGIIVLSAVLTATNADILAGTRLQNAPANGIVTFEMNASLAVAANNFTTTIQMPNGDTPLNNILVPGTNPALEGVIDERQKLMISLPVFQGGHIVWQVVLTGAAFFNYRVSFTPA